MVAPNTLLKPSTPSSPADDGCIGLALDMPSRGSDEGRDSGSSSTTAPDSSSLASPQHHRSDLEERVQELEEKLATLSLLLQQQKGRSSRSISPPSITPPASPPVDEDEGQDGSNYLALDSPSAQTPLPTINSRRRRNLSFRVLHSPDSPRQTKVMTELAESMYMPDGLPEFQVASLVAATQAVSPIRPTTNQTSSACSPSPGPASPDNNHTDAKSMPLPRTTLALRKDETSQVTFTQELKRTASMNSNPEKNDVKSKWLDYLNSFQESNYDTDKQMEEFVKIPSAVEALLSFGFWICVDSFLYILTILPIRFVWSCLLLARFLVIRMFHKQVPEGPFRFHRRYVIYRQQDDGLLAANSILTLFYFV